MIGEEWTDEVVPNFNKDKCYDIRSKIFDRLFKVYVVGLHNKRHSGFPVFDLIFSDFS